MSYQRQITSDYPVKCIKVEGFNPDDLIGWLEGQAKTHKLTYLLAHAMDGVIWGRLDETDDRIHTSHDALHNTQTDGKWDAARIKAATKTLPALRVESLQQARLFGEQAELYVWQDGDGGWNGRLLTGVEGETADWSESFDEPQMLWGTHGTPLADKFTLLEDGAQGLYHAAPVELKLNGKDNGAATPPRLLVRHYLDYDKQGQAYIAVSRLVTLEK